MIDSIVITWNFISEQYLMTILEINKPIKSYNKETLVELLDILHTKVKNETKYTS